MKQATTIAMLAYLLAFPANAHCYSVWHYNFPQRCGRVAQIEAPVPPSKPVYLQTPDDIDMPLPSLENMEFPPDCMADWCERLKGVGLLREKFGTN